MLDPCHSPRLGRHVHRPAAAATSMIRWAVVVMVGPGRNGGRRGGASVVTWLAAARRPAVEPREPEQGHHHGDRALPDAARLGKF